METFDLTQYQQHNVEDLARFGFEFQSEAIQLAWTRGYESHYRVPNCLLQRAIDRCDRELPTRAH